MSFPAILVGTWTFSITPMTSAWPLCSIFLFILGLFLTTIAFIYLGKSFAVLPAARRLVIGGPFRYVRHPAYLGQWLILLACGISIGTAWSVIPAIIAIPLLVIRAKAEEDLLATSSHYNWYKRHVRWRFIPGIL